MAGCQGDGCSKMQGRPRAGTTPVLSRTTFDRLGGQADEQIHPCCPDRRPGRGRLVVHSHTRFHKIGNVLPALPKSAHPGATKAMAEIWGAEDRDHARRAVAAFTLAYGAKFGKAVTKITDDLDELLRFNDYPAEHWIHLRTANPIESTFATVRNRSKITEGRGSKAAGVAMAFELIEAAQDRWRAVSYLVAFVCAGAAFTNGRLVERATPSGATQAEAAWPRSFIHKSQLLTGQYAERRAQMERRNFTRGIAMILAAITVIGLFTIASGTPASAAQPCVGQPSWRRVDSDTVNGTWNLFCNDGRFHDFVVAAVYQGPVNTFYYRKVCYATTHCSFSHNFGDGPGLQVRYLGWDPASNGTQVDSSNLGRLLCNAGIDCQILRFSA
jgi:hypothetical protein